MNKPKTTTDSKYPYLLLLYHRVDGFLDNRDIDKKLVPDIVVSFCVVLEKIIKIKLHTENPFLVFDSSKFKEDDSLVMVAKKEEKNIETIRIVDAINRLRLVFRDIFTDDELQALEDLYNLRNQFVHSYKLDSDIDFNIENIVKKMGTIWEKISEHAVIILGKKNIKGSKPKRKYTEEELEEVLVEEVRKKISPSNNSIFTFPDISRPPISSWQGGERCPRCKGYGFSEGPFDFDSLRFTGYLSADQLGSGLFKCKECNLELTTKEYRIAQGLNNNP